MTRIADGFCPLGLPVLLALAATLVLAGLMPQKQTAKRPANRIGADYPATVGCEKPATVWHYSQIVWRFQHDAGAPNEVNVIASNQVHAPEPSNG